MGLNHLNPHECRMQCNPNIITAVSWSQIWRLRFPSSNQHLHSFHLCYLTTAPWFHPKRLGHYSTLQTQSSKFKHVTKATSWIIPPYRSAIFWWVDPSVRDSARSDCWLYRGCLCSINFPFLTIVVETSIFSLLFWLKKVNSLVFMLKHVRTC